MKKLLIIFLTFSQILSAQTTIEFDYMETFSTSYSTAGWWTPAATAGWVNNASVSSPTSARIYGAGNGSSTIEQDWYSLPNITGLDINKMYQLRFRLASYVFSNSTATTRGLDAADYVSVQVSIDGGINYINELRILGNSNATWPYSSTGFISHIANGSFTNSAGPTGDVYQAPAGASTTGPSNIILDLPTGISQVAIDIYCRVNSAGEEWWLDNIELVQIDPLPVELLSFYGTKSKNGNLIVWKTASENNSSHYLIERSTTGYFDDENTIIGTEQAMGYSTQLVSYYFIDNEFPSVLNYYRIKQYDNDGSFKIYGPVVVDNMASEKVVVKVINLLGQDVDEFATGVLFEVYEDGTSSKIMR